ncbi:MAG: ParB/RepB/Spo0J family partition protein [Planctomycetota bacterium]|nr:MAG: ParB/RepB/Spo0J family partition protein [Planctomycetota bacterium]RLS94842.1 MAG: ParB/RepB/Spo0J family partition protein [Planctomycetota bacterium]
MTPIDQHGKNTVRKLGRGLSALLGNPVQIQITQMPSVQEIATTPPLVASAVAPTTGVSPEALAPTVPFEVPPFVTKPGPVPSSVPPASSATTSLAVQTISAAVPHARHSGLRELPVEQIVPNRRQPRTDFDEASLMTLAESIKKAGVMQPIMVRPTETGFELVAGERRWRAAKLIGLATIPAMVKDLDDQTAAELALIENIQREDLNPMERAIALRRLAMDFGLTHQVIADRVGLDRATVSNLLRLSELDPTTADLIRTGKLSQGHAKALLGITDVGLRAELASLAIAGDWSVRELERSVQKKQHQAKSVESRPTDSTTEPNARDANVADLERQLAEHLGTRVNLQLGRKKGSGRLVVEFYNLDQFDGLMQKMGFGASKR